MISEAPPPEPEPPTRLTITNRMPHDYAEALHEQGIFFQVVAQILEALGVLLALDGPFYGCLRRGVGWAVAEAAARRSCGGLPALVVEVAAGGRASGSTSGCVNRTGLPSDRA